MKQLIFCICIIIFGVSCAPRTPKRTPAHDQEVLSTDSFTVFITGYELGTLKPCGCSGGQLGGFDRRSAILNAVQEQKRLIINTGSFVNSDNEQDLIKYHIIIQALQLLDYDLINLTEQDIEIGRNLGQLESIDEAFNTISPHDITEIDTPEKFTKKFSLKGRIVLATVVTIDPDSTPAGQLENLFALPSDVPSLNILILSKKDSGTIESITRKASFVDCIICPSESDEPAVIGNPNRHPLVITVGRFGRYICGLKVTPPSRIGQSLRLAFKALPVDESLPKEDSLVRLYEDYQLIVKERNLLEKHPRFNLPDDLEYMGSQSCKPCHSFEYEKWSTKAHSKAFSTLEKVGSQFDPECVVCHVIGMDYESGYISQQETEHLMNVGCENCHGPGSEHILTAGDTKLTEPKSTCIDCHTPEHSGDYAGNEEAFLEKIKHWREPNAAGNVK
jgi:hypothetical protein